MGSLVTVTGDMSKGCLQEVSASLQICLLPEV